MEQRTLAQLREHYLIEKELASRLRRASRTERRELYHVVYDERARRIAHHPLVVRASDPQAQARAVLPQARLLGKFVNRETTFLEIGPGDCALAFEMAKWVKQVYALDVSGELTRQTERPSNFEFRLFDGLELPLPPNSIDLAYSNDVLEHLHPEDACDQLRSLVRVLKPGGKYICITPNRLAGPHDVSRHFDQEATGFHLKEYTIRELTNLFRSVGFSEIQAFVSVHGQRLLPPFHIQPYTLIEQLVQKVPLEKRRGLASFLMAIKVIATK